MTILDQLSWWEFGLWCVLISVFGSFVKTFCLDNVTSIKDIFKHILTSIFIAVIICIYGNYRFIDKRLQLIFSGFAGIIGIRAVFYITGKCGGLFSDIGKFLEGVTYKENQGNCNTPRKPNEPKDRTSTINSVPTIREQRKRNLGLDNEKRK